MVMTTKLFIIYYLTNKGLALWKNNNLFFKLLNFFELEKHAFLTIYANLPTFSNGKKMETSTASSLIEISHPF